MAADGLSMAARHSALHVVRDVGQGLSLDLLGAHTYIWAAFISWFGVVLMAVLLLLLNHGEAARTVRDPGPLGRAAL